VGYKGKYPYILLGDDCLDTNEHVYHEYLNIMNLLGVSVSPSKCTVSNNAFAEFAKRLFSPKGEITGLPVDLLLGCYRRPESLLEVIRLMRLRGYLDNNIRPGVLAFLESWPKRTKKLMYLVLSSPSIVTGAPPLLEGDTNPEPFTWPEDELLKQHVLNVRKYLFWREVDKIVQAIQKGTAPVPPKGTRVPFSETHIALVSIGESLMEYIASENEFSIWDNWINGKDYHMLYVPTIERYQYRNRGHYNTRCRYEIAKMVIQIINGQPLPLNIHVDRKLSNFDLMKLGFPGS
jgi:hypothetical protein